MDIQVFNLRVESLGQSVDWWNTAMIWALVFAAIAAVAVVITTRKSITQAGKLSEAQAELARAKESELARELKSRDEVIAATKERTAKLELDTISLQKKLVAQGSRAVLLYGGKRDVLVDKLKPFHGQKVEIRFCRVSFNQAFIDNDTMGVVMLLQAILSTGANWAVNPLAIENCSGTGIQVTLDPKASERTKKAAGALWSALDEVPLLMLGDKPFVMESPRPLQPLTFDCGTTSTCANKPVDFPPLDADTIVLTVLAHPQT